jgi:NAD(P)-dependent dehydrogenase (short-subunit alcohol dehydrogenase family)
MAFLSRLPPRGMGPNALAWRKTGDLPASLDKAFIISSSWELTLMPAKTALVTGANGGLGTQVTKALLDAGFAVVGLAPKIRQSDVDHPNFTALAASLDSLNAAKQATDTIIARFGKIDVVAHLVGGFAGGQTVADTDDATFQRMFDMNLNSAFHLLRAVIPHMRKAGSGRIIAIGSRASEAPGPRVGAYSASKAALVSLMRTVALENKDAGIAANVILPGTMDTPANRKAMPSADVSEWVQPASVASLIVWLAGDGGKDVAGAAIPVYGQGL